MTSTKTRMLESATALLLSKGVESTAVDDILKASGTGKSQFYHYFGSKSGMIAQVLEHVRARLAAGQWGRQVLPTIDSWPAVESWLKLFADAQEGDHPLALLILTMPPSERALQPALQQLYDEIRAPLLAFLEGEQEAGRFVAGVNCTDLADLALTGMLGASIKTSLTKTDAQAHRDKTARHLFMYLKAYARV